LAWAPDSKRLLVLFIIGREWGLYLVSATEPDIEPVLLREGQYFFSRRAWSPDGRYVAVDQMSGDTFLLNARDGNIVQQLPRGGNNGL
jgi:hypothetical protein